MYQAGIELWSSGELQMHLRQSLYRLAWVFIGAGLACCSAGDGLFRPVEEFCSLFFNAVRQVPVIAFIPCWS